MSDKALPPLPPGEKTPTADRPVHPTRALSDSDRFISDFAHGTIIQSGPPSYISQSGASSTAPKYTKRPTNYLDTRTPSATSGSTTIKNPINDRSSIISSSSSAEDSEREFDDDRQADYPASTLAPSEEDHDDDVNEGEWSDENKDKARTWTADGEGGDTRVDMRDDGRIDVKLSVTGRQLPLPSQTISTYLWH